MRAISEHKIHLTHCVNDIAGFGRLKPAIGTPGMLSVLTFFWLHAKQVVCIPINVTVHGCATKCCPTHADVCIKK
jgi:hypothetical protein